VQPFKGVEHYFTNSLIYQADIEPLKQSFPNDVNSGNEADSESEEVVLATISVEPVVAYLDDFDYNNPVENEGEWVLNENIAFYYSLCLEDISVNVKSLHMPLLISEMACMHIQDNEGSVVIVLLAKGTNHQLYLTEVGLKPRHLENQTMTWNPHNSFIMHG